ncbi:MAG TPA: nucleotidyltransferase family protein [Verrucomicrobiae bacterium]|nr:nucleotidyltransferase family protein [Verrucomicrobiae bacterium]
MLTVAILAGGLATRLRPITETIPKALVEVAGEPFLAHQLRLLARAGYRRVVMCVGYRAAQIREFAGDGGAFGLHVDYSPDGPVLLGTAGAIRRALPLLGDAFAVVYGDSYLTCDYGAAERVFLESGKPGLMTVYRNEGQWDTSNVEFTGGRIVAYDKVNRTPAMRYIDYGLGMFQRAAFDDIPADRPSDLASLYQDLLRRGELAAWESPDRFYEIGSAEGIRDLAEFLSK